MQSVVSVQHALAVIAEPSIAMRELIRRTIEDAGFVVLEVAALHHLGVVLRTRAAAAASDVLLVIPADMVAAPEAAIANWMEQRAASGRPSPCVVLTREFGTLADAPSPKLKGCVTIGILEKPFDLALLQGMAHRVRARPTDGEPLAVPAS